MGVIIGECVPKRKSRLNSHPVWFTRDLISLLKEKEKIRQKSRKFNNPRDKIEFDILRNRCERLMRSCYTKYIGSIECNLKKNPKLFWSYIKHKRSGTGIPTTMHIGQQFASSNSSDIANLFATHFSSIYTNSSKTIPPSVVKNSALCYGFLDRIGISIPRPNARRISQSFFSVPRSRTNLGSRAPVVRLTSTYNQFWRLYDLDIYHDRPALFRSKIIKKNMNMNNVPI
ncbi:hypothetical protein SFRURICE_010509 [Spodoptera frugiperda]|nr:hypothetical protein SFRURICE_010509 [Spodoptera frugiperda]